MASNQNNDVMNESEQHTIFSSNNNDSNYGNAIVEDSDNDDIITLEDEHRPDANNSLAIQVISANTSIIEVQATRNHRTAAQLDVYDDSDEDEENYKRSNKMPRLHSNLDLKSAATNTKENKSPENEEELCSICLEPWTNAGLHRIVCLKCGHLFGESCIERWLKDNQKCPQCNHPSRKTDIRRIYAKAIKVIDNSELEQALKELDSEKHLRKKAEIQASETKLKFQATERELQILNSNYKLLQEQLSQQKKQFSINGATTSQLAANKNLETKCNFMRYVMDKIINISQDNGGCRTIAYSARFEALLVSQQSNTSIFPGFGIKKINFHDTKLSQYIPIHSKLIRDLAVNTTQQDDGIILTCGLDKTIRLTNLANNALVHSYECPHPIWSCTYNLDDPIYFFCGLANGHVMLFDKRRIDRHVDTLNSALDIGSPVCSLQYVPRSDDTAFNRSGLLISQLDKLSFFELKQNEEYTYHPLLVESNIMSCCFEPNTRSILLSTRPTVKHSTVRHLTYEFNPVSKDEIDPNVTLNLSRTYNGANSQKMLAKSRLFTYESRLYGCAPEETTKSVVIWDVKSNETRTKLANFYEAIDVCPIDNFNNSSFIASLSDKQLRIFKNQPN